tara:strand:+ start:27690 stop:28490 length:801 start_codon:yes stop_codon:yes gene_type:complete
LVIILFVLFSSKLFAESPPLKVSQGLEQRQISSETEIGELCVELDIEKEVAKSIANTSLPLSLDDKFSNTPFLYFFNGLRPKNSSDKRIWSIGGHYLHIVKLGELISVNNLYFCGSLKISNSKDHLLCKTAKGTKLINFDGTLRDSSSTGNICPPKKAVKSVSYGNCILFLKKDSLRCEVEMTWPSTEGESLKKHCHKVEIEGDFLHCRRKKLKNSEKINLVNNCFTDSSIMTAPKVFDNNRGDLFKRLDSGLQPGKEPPSETIKK